MIINPPSSCFGANQLSHFSFEPSGFIEDSIEFGEFGEFGAAFCAFSLFIISAILLQSLLSMSCSSVGSSAP